MNVLDLLIKNGAENPTVNSSLRQACPAEGCGGKRTLQVSSEEFAYCHKCRQRWSTNSVDGKEWWVADTLRALATQCYKALHTEGPLATTAWDWLLSTRKLERDVVSNGPVGIVPARLDVAAIQSAAEASFAKSRVAPIEPPTDKREAKKQRAYERHLAIVAEEQAQFDGMLKQIGQLKDCAGWIALFYTDAAGFSSVKLRQPGEKTFRFIKLVPNKSGLFMPTRVEDGYPAGVLQLMDNIGDTTVTGDFLAVKASSTCCSFTRRLYERIARQVSRASCPCRPVHWAAALTGMWQRC